jgi:hypothetical protein
LPCLRDVADDGATPDDDRLTLTASRALRSVAAAFAAALLLTAPLVALAAEPTPGAAPTPAPPTCAERFPEDGPAGVDLRLGCIVSQVVGLYTAGQQAPPPTLSTYAIALAGVLVGGIILALLVGRVVRRRAGERLAPVLAGEWWACPSCHSVNGAGVAHCYSCGATRPDGPTLRTDDAPATPQSFGSTRKRG